MLKYQTKITLIGAYGEGNIGDDLLMENLVVWLNDRFPNIIPLLIVREKSNVINIIKNLKVEVVDDYTSYDVETDIAIYGGGTQFFDFKLSKGIILNNRIGQILNPIKTYRKRKAKKVISSKENILLGVGFGPFESKDSVGYTNFSRVIKKASLVCVRDQRSYELASEVYNGQLVLGTDICFNSFFYKRLESFIRPKNESKKDKSKEKVAIILRQWNYNNIDQIKLFESINEYVDQNPNTNFDLILFRKEKDKRILKYFKSKNNLQIKSWNPKKDSFEDFLTNYSLYDSILTSRFHGAIFCGLLNIPFVCIIIEPKLLVPSTIWNKNVAFESPFSKEKLEEVYGKLKKENINYTSYNKDEIIKGDKMLNTVELFIKEKLKLEL